MLMKDKIMFDGYSQKLDETGAKTKKQYVGVLYFIASSQATTLMTYYANLTRAYHVYVVQISVNYIRHVIDRKRKGRNSNASGYTRYRKQAKENSLHIN